MHYCTNLRNRDLQLLTMQECIILGRDALQELWITRCIGWAPLATMHPARFGLPDPLEGLSGWLGGDYDAQDPFFFLEKVQKKTKKCKKILKNQQTRFGGVEWMGWGRLSF